MASGAVRADYKILRVFLGVVWFSLIGVLTYFALDFITQYLIAIQYISIFGFIFEIINVVIAIVVVTVAYLWRKCIAEWVFRCLRDLGITTTPFGPSGAWDVLESTPDGREFHYVRVSLENGKQLGSDLAKLTRKWREGDIDFSPDITVDEQGNVSLIVTDVWDKNADESEKKLSDG